MLAIRMQRTGRSGHAQFRVIVQDSRFSPTRGRVVSYLGSYDPHTKSAKLDTVKAGEYLANGAVPSDTVARLFQKEGIKLPGWVKLDKPKERSVRNPEKRRSTRPADAAAPAETPAETPAEEPATEAAAEPAAEEQSAEAPAEEPSAAAEPEPAAAKEPASETPAENAEKND